MAKQTQEQEQIVDREIARRLSDALAEDWRGFRQIETVEQALAWMCGVSVGLRECEAAHVMSTNRAQGANVP